MLVKFGVRNGQRHRGSLGGGRGGTESEGEEGIEGARGRDEHRIARPSRHRPTRRRPALNRAGQSTSLVQTLRTPDHRERHYPDVTDISLRPDATLSDTESRHSQIDWLEEGLLVRYTGGGGGGLVAPTPPTVKRGR